MARINLKFLTRLEKIPLQALEMVQQVYGDNTISHIRVFSSQRGCEEVKDDARSETLQQAGLKSTSSE